MRTPSPRITSEQRDSLVQAGIEVVDSDRSLRSPVQGLAGFWLEGGAPVVHAQCPGGRPRGAPAGGRCHTVIPRFQVDLLPEEGQIRVDYKQGRACIDGATQRKVPIPLARSICPEWHDRGHRRPAPPAPLVLHPLRHEPAILDDGKSLTGSASRFDDLGGGGTLQIDESWSLTRVLK